MTDSSGLLSAVPEQAASFGRKAEQAGGFQTSADQGRGFVSGDLVQSFVINWRFDSSVELWLLLADHDQKRTRDLISGVTGDIAGLQLQGTVVAAAANHRGGGHMPGALVRGQDCIGEKPF